MIPVRLKIQGFLSYREPVEVDFTAFDLACITGHNGAGKSTLLDAITWALFGEARRRDDALINNLESVAEVSFEFDYEGNRYRIQRSKSRNKTSTLEFHTLSPDGTWLSRTEHSMRETEACIRSVLHMDFDTFINASFFLQGKADLFAQQKPADRKRILSTILGLEVWESYREAAAERRRQAENKLSQIRNEISEREDELSEEDERRRQLVSLESDLQILAQLRQSKEEAVNRLKQLTAMLENQRAHLASQQERIQTDQQRIDQLTRRLEEQRKRQRLLEEEITHAAEIEAAYAAWQKLDKELKHWEALSSRYLPLQQQRTQYENAVQTERVRLEQEIQHLQEDQKKFLQDQNELSIAQTKLTDLHASTAALEVQIQFRKQLEQQRLALREQMAEKSAEMRRWQEKRDTLQERIQRLQSTEEEETCPLCGQPLQQSSRADRLAQLNLELEQILAHTTAQGDELSNLKHQQQQIEHQYNTTAVYESELNGLNRQASALEARIEQLQKNITEWHQLKLPRLNELEDRLNRQDFAWDERARLAEIDAALSELGYDLEAHQTTRQAEQDARSANEKMRLLENARIELNPLLDEIRANEQSLNTEITALEQLRADYQKAAQDYRRQTENLPNVQSAERELIDIKQRETNLHREVGAARQRVEVLVSVRQRLQTLKSQSEEVSRLLSRLKTLERAFGKDGVPALLIEQALPEIEAQANQILDQLSNGSMTIRFDTQRDFKDKNREDKKETLDIIISDPAGQRAYEMYSGGEAFRVNFAIRLALSRVLAHRAGARLQTLFVDEGFGSQDAEGRQRLIEAINAVRNDFAKILVITHLEELKDAFPARIEVEKTSSGSAARVMVA